MAFEFPRCHIIPLPDDQVSFQIDGAERTRWHFGSQYPRPFFYPFNGPSGETLTRMGHPGAPNHDHHRSVWFAHHKVDGVNFWGDSTESKIEQKQWLCYRDGNDEAIMASLLSWQVGHEGAEIIQQQLVAAIRPTDVNGETLIELQSTFTPTAAKVEFQRTNFGFLAVRVAKHISKHFGSGELTNSEGARGEQNIFGKPARWMDYSGTVPGPEQRKGMQGITYIDHPSNPGQPMHWHVREDGWMGASVCMKGPQLVTKDKPLTVRFLLHAHAGDIDIERATAIANSFAISKRLEVRKARARHQQYEVVRLK
jgi:hypothetical protein